MPHIIFTLTQFDVEFEAQEIEIAEANEEWEEAKYRRHVVQNVLAAIRNHA